MVGGGCWVIGWWWMLGDWVVVDVGWRVDGGG